ncbi:uncharacterized protein [Drosophila bipectinata]|uniref:uncharacterized protein n=1 Tax=Drosophila bipectinata TaxID=42026 RepID=UPI0007E80DF3|nr:uncharacterized protein LOC108124105 [Drosophila bipectinata]KAH8261927.1 hypothetical protein KR026_004243 [Drosophila bipectinata]
MAKAKISQWLKQVRDAGRALQIGDVTTLRDPSKWGFPWIQAGNRYLPWSDNAGKKTTNQQEKNINAGLGGANADKVKTGPKTTIEINTKDSAQSTKMTKLGYFGRAFYWWRLPEK